VGGLVLSGDMGRDMCIFPELWERMRRREWWAEGLTTVRAFLFIGIFNGNVWGWLCLLDGIITANFAAQSAPG